jgi:hypothetical protein
LVLEKAGEVDVFLKSSDACFKLIISLIECGRGFEAGDGVVLCECEYFFEVEPEHAF